MHIFDMPLFFRRKTVEMVLRREKERTHTEPSRRVHWLTVRPRLSTGREKLPGRSLVWRLQRTCVTTPGPPLIKIRSSRVRSSVGSVLSLPGREWDQARQAKALCWIVRAACRVGLPLFFAGALFMCMLYPNY